MHLCQEEFDKGLIILCCTTTFLSTFTHNSTVLLVYSQFLLDNNFNTKVSHSILKISNNFFPVNNIGIRFLAFISWLINLRGILCYLHQTSVTVLISCISSYLLEDGTEARACVPFELLVLMKDFLPVDTLVTGELLCHEAGQHSFNPQSSRSRFVLEEPGLQYPDPTTSK